MVQFRYDKQDIPSPGVWSLFGGMVNEDEDTGKAVEREIYKDLSIVPSSYKYLWWMNYYFSYHFQKPARSSLYVADVREVWTSDKLNEGAM